MSSIIEQKNTKTLWVWAAIILLTLVLLFLPFKLPYKITVAGKVFPAKEWIVMRGNDGRLMSFLINYRAGVNENYSVNLFERGDVIQFNLHPNISAGNNVSALDTIGIIYSNESEKQLINLKTDLDSQNALLEVNLTQEKESIVSAAEKNVVYAERKLEEQQRIFNRQKGLLGEDLISQEEFDLSKEALDLFIIKIEIAQERLRTVTTGAKEEEIKLIKSKILGLQGEISVLEQKFSDYIILSPIAGRINRVFSSDTLLIISDTTEYIVFMPIEWNYRKFITTDMPVNIDYSFFNEELSGHIISVEKKAEFIDQNVVIFAAALFKDNIQNLVPGLVIECSIICDDLTPREHLIRFLQSLFV